MGTPLPRFLGLPPPAAGKRVGAALLGPPSPFLNAVLKASEQVELYDEELGEEPARRGIRTIRRPPSRLAGTVRSLYRQGTFVLFMGYRLTDLAPPVLPAGPAALFTPRAESDLTDRLRRRGLEPLTCVGHRVGRPSGGRGPHPVWVIPARLFAGGRIPRMTSGHAPPLQSVIVDPLSLDPSVLPAPQNREPGGLRWFETFAALRGLYRPGRPAAAAVLPCRLPARDPAAPFLVARLAAKIIAYSQTDKDIA